MHISIRIKNRVLGVVITGRTADRLGETVGEIIQCPGANFGPLTNNKQFTEPISGALGIRVQQSIITYWMYLLSNGIDLMGGGQGVIVSIGAGIKK